MIDADGYRPNVGIILMNERGQLLWARRVGQNAWQFPQGGIKADETPEEALYRELKEEVGLEPHQVEIVGRTRGWLRYRLPKRMLRHIANPCVLDRNRNGFCYPFAALTRACVSMVQIALSLMGGAG